MTRRRAGQWIVGGFAALAVGGEYVAFQKHRAMVNARLIKARWLRLAGSAYALDKAAESLRKGLLLDSRRADLWGLLAVVRMEQARLLAPARRGPLMEGAFGATDRALELDPKQPDARTADAARNWAMFDYIRYEAGLRSILGQAPATLPALEDLTAFLQGVGRWEQAAGTNAKELTLAPRSATAHRSRAFEHWRAGRIGAADHAIADGLAHWPGNALLLHAQLVLHAFTGREPAALLLLGRWPLRHYLGKRGVLLWRTGLKALPRRKEAARAAATIRKAAGGDERLGGDAAMLLSALGQLDGAFALARSVLDTSGELLPDGSRSSAPAVRYGDPVWRRARWLFTPAAKAMRADARFTDLCRRSGLLFYWQRSGNWPDAALRGSLAVTPQPVASG